MKNLMNLFKSIAALFMVFSSLTAMAQENGNNLPTDERIVEQILELTKTSGLAIENVQYIRNTGVMAKLDRAMFTGHHARVSGQVKFSYKGKSFRCSLTAWSTVTSMGNCSTSGFDSRAQFIYSDNKPTFVPDSRLTLTSESTGYVTLLDLDGTVLSKSGI